MRTWEVLLFITREMADLVLVIPRHPFGQENKRLNVPESA